MSNELFAALGLAPGRYDAANILRRYRDRRSVLLQQLADPLRRMSAHRRLDELHLAYNALRDPPRQERYREMTEQSDNRVAYVRHMIESSLEGDLLRLSRRQQIIKEGRRCGLSPFHTQLLIAQVQFGQQDLIPIDPVSPIQSAQRISRLGARLAAGGVLALALFLAMVRWLAL